MLSRAGGLHHLIRGAVAFLEEAFSGAKGEMIENLGFAAGEEVPVVSAGEEKAGIFWWHGEKRNRPYTPHGAYRAYRVGALQALRLTSS
jgi:hypothetical protein